MKHLLITSFLALAFSLNGWSQCMHVPSDNWLISEGISKVVEAKVVQLNSIFTSNGNIITQNYLEVYKEFGGSVTDQQLLVITEGGIIGNTAQLVYPSVSFSKGSIVICTIREKDGQLLADRVFDFNRVSGSFSTPTGNVEPTEMYRSIAVALGSDEINVRKELPFIETDNRMSPPQIASYSPTIISAGTKEELTITGSGFGFSQGDGCVSFSNANDGGQSFVSLPSGPHYVSWADNEIKVLVPSSMLFGNVVAGTGNVRVTNHNGGVTDSDQPLEITYAQGEIVYQDLLGQTSLVGLNNGGYGFSIGNQLLALTQGTSMVELSLEKWACNTGVNFFLNDQNPVTEQFAQDQINVIGMAPLGSMPSNVLGKTITTFSGCGAGNGVEWQLVETDILFNPNANWYMGNGIPPTGSFDLQTVVLHELGHAHLIQHNNDDDSVMFFELNEHASRRFIDDETDIMGGSMIVDRSVNFAPTCSSPSMEFYNNVECNVSQLNSINNEGESLFAVTPNPSVGLIHVVLEKTIQQWSLIDLTGRTISVEPVLRSDLDITLDLSNLPKGIYVLNVQGEGFNRSKRIVLQ